MNSANKHSLKSRISSVWENINYLRNKEKDLITQIDLVGDIIKNTIDNTDIEIKRGLLLKSAFNEKVIAGATKLLIKASDKLDYVDTEFHPEKYLDQPLGDLLSDLSKHTRMVIEKYNSTSLENTLEKYENSLRRLQVQINDCKVQLDTTENNMQDKTKLHTDEMVKLKDIYKDMKKEEEEGRAEFEILKRAVNDAKAELSGKSKELTEMQKQIKELEESIKAKINFAEVSNTVPEEAIEENASGDSAAETSGQK